MTPMKRGSLARVIAVGAPFLKGAIDAVNDQLASSMGLGSFHPGLDSLVLARERLAIILSLAIELPTVGVGNDVIADPAERDMPASVFTLLKDEGQDRRVGR